jgi:hypothetical protein
MAERRKNPGDDDGVVTSAPSAAGNLLSDMLSSMKTDVAQERRERVESEAQKREREAREAREREEARLRMAAQEKLNQEARLRNESLNKARSEAGEVRDEVTTGQHKRPAVAPAPAPAPVSVATSVPEVPARGGASWGLVAAVTLLAAGLGFGGALAVQPEPRGVFVDLTSAARATVNVVGKAAAAELAAKAALEKEAARVKELEASVKAVETAKADLEAKNAELEAAAAAGGARPAATAPAAAVRRPSGGSGMPSLKGGIF